MDYLPVFINLHKRPVLVVGGGDVATRKIRLLIKSGATISILSPVLNRELQELVRSKSLNWIPKCFAHDNLSRYVLVYAATNDPAVNQRVFACGEAANTLVNAVDDKVHCSFISPAIVDRSPVLLAISTGGASPVLARILRSWLERELPQHLGRVAQFAQAMRDRVKSGITRISRRRLFWEHVLDSPVKDHLLAGRTGQAQHAFDHLLQREHAAAEHDDNAPGVVSLVGAGPGDAGLLTLRALQVMQAADVVLFDKLVSNDVLDLCRRDADLIDVGKRAGNHKLQQIEIHSLLIQFAQQGKRVVRLKGGDPFVFGRGGEELQALAEAGIDAEVVPGISAASACAAAIQLPLTHRSMARSLTFVTAHCQGSKACVDWASLAGKERTLVFYMGVGQVRTIQFELIRHGLAQSTPWAIIENGTRENQRVFFGKLDQLEQAVSKEQIAAPAVLIVGAVAQLPQQLEATRNQARHTEFHGTPLRATA